VKESDFLQWVFQQDVSGGYDKILVGPGDDMAAVNFNGSQLLVGIDQVLDMVHFDLKKHGARAAGRKSLARNLSDVAAMAAEPAGAVASVALPGSLTDMEARQIYLGMKELAEEFECPIAGGDISVWPAKMGLLHISVCIFAKPSDGGKVAPVLRSNAKPGDAICVTGDLGGAWHTSRHLEFTPRIREAADLARKHQIHSMIDISDGLATDLYNLCNASKTGAEIFADAVPVHPEAGRCGVSPLSAALADGEDYELLFTLPDRLSDAVCSDDGMDLKVTKIGVMTDAGKVVITDRNGKQKPLEKSGWEYET